jgi:hypothetical protein
MSRCSTSSKARRATVALSRPQVEFICYSMGWEYEDTAAFWRLARRETRNPGCLKRESRKVGHRIIKSLMDGGQL